MKARAVVFSQTKNTRQIAEAIAAGIANKRAEVEILDWLKIKDAPRESVLGGCDLHQAP